jgi:uncharacterized protein (DUF4213/DUF364 family)
MLTDDICGVVPALAAGHCATDIRIGLGYTAVRLEDGRCGLAYTLHEEEYESCCVIPEAGTLTGRSVAELAEYLRSADTTACAIGLAAINAVVSVPAGAVESDILDLLPAGSEDAVGMVGYFGPLIEPLKKRARALYIFERRPNPEIGVLPESAAREILPQCQVAILSATTLLNHTIDDLLDFCKSAREIALLGPSTPFLPDIFSRHGVTILSGLQVVDAPQVLRVVSEGGGTRQFGPAARKLTLRTKSWGK